MSEAILICIISGGLTLIGTVLTVLAGNSKIQSSIQEHNSVQDEKIRQLYETMSDLKNETKKHNEYGIRIPILENKIESIEKQLSKLGDDAK